jgi:integrase
MAMGRPLGKKTGADLTALAIRKLKPGVHRAADHLYVQVTPRRSMSWVNRFTGPDGKVHHKGLGSLDLVSLAEAKELILKNRKLLHAGQDPMAKAATLSTFIEVACQYYDAHQAEWGSDRYRKQWWEQMAKHIHPKIGKLAIDQITTASVISVIKPLWGVLQYAPTLRGRIEQVWDYAKAAKLVKGDNPAQMKGNLAPLLGDITQIRQTEHRPALPFARMPSFMARLRQVDSIDARALEVTILTNVRTNATLGARWTEIDLELATWTIPAERVKGRKAQRKAFRVPLNRRAIAILQSLPRYGEFVFSRPDGKPAGENAMLILLRTFNQVDENGEPVVVHGFRSSFNDWAAESTPYPHAVIETAMQHAVKGKVEASYRRGDLFSQRMSLMADWADWCERETA